MRHAILYLSSGIGLYAFGVAVLLAFGVYTSPQFAWSADLAWLCG